MDLVAGAVGSIIRKLGVLLQAEYKLQKGLPEKIESLKRELETAHTSLRMLGEVPREQLDPLVKQWASEVREASYDMEDILDAFLVNIVYEETSSTSSASYDMEDCLGKTTLAKAVYDELKHQYDCGAFVSVGRKPDLLQVFVNIFYDLDRKQYKAVREVKSLQLLIRELRKFLQNKRYFIVIDDVWDIACWETIKSALGQRNTGSRVIATTRNRDLASDEVYELDPLSCDDSRKLFYTRLFGAQGKCPADHPDEASKKILKKCGGVPLAIITIASLLVGKSGEDWFDVCNSPGFYRVHKDNKQVDDTTWILSLSYYDLPSHLKSCLLYLSVYPEDYLIEKSSLIWKWIAEGLIKQKTGTSLYQLGEECFNQLINRSMIQAVEREKGICGCRVHDMVLDLIRDLSEEANFVTISDDNEGVSSRSKVRRLAHQNRAMRVTRNDVAHVRSLVACRCDIGSWILHPSFKLLRVLALERCGGVQNNNGGHVLAHVGSLIHLRYLGLREMWNPKLPKGIGALRHLQTLDLQGCKSTEAEVLPSSVCLLTQLVCLRTGMLTIVPDGFLRKVTSLEELDMCASGSSESQFIKELGNLSEARVLRVFFLQELNPSMQSDLLRSLGNLQKLQHLALRSFGETCPARQWDTVVLPRHLRLLVIQIIQFPRLPSWVNPEHLTNLSHLELFVDHIDAAGLRALGGLPELRYLDLRCFWPLMSYSKITVAYSVTSTADVLFQKLRRCNLEGWIVQLMVVKEDSTSSVSFVTWNGKGHLAAFAAEAKHQCSSRVAPAVGFMPNLQHLAFDVPVKALYKYARDGSSCENLGLECLASLRKVVAVVRCEDASADDVDKAQAELKRATQLHPNRPLLQIVMQGHGHLHPRRPQDDAERGEQ